MNKFYKARKWLVNKLGGAMIEETLPDNCAIRQFTHSVEKVVVLAYEHPFLAAHNGCDMSDEVKTRLVKKLADGLCKRGFIKFDRERGEEGGLIYTAELYAVKVDEDASSMTSAYKESEG